MEERFIKKKREIEYKNVRHYDRANKRERERERERE